MFKNWTLLFIVGILSIAGGILAIFDPFVATITAVMICAWMFLVVGGLQLYYVWINRDKPHRIWSVVGGGLAIMTGVLLFVNPLAGAYSLTIILAILLLFSGVNKLLVAFSMREHRKTYTSILLSGIISLLLAGWLWLDINQFATNFLGYLLAIELLINGYMMSLIAFHHRK